MMRGQSIGLQNDHLIRVPRRSRSVARDAARVRPRRDATVPASTPASPGDGPAVPVEIRLRAPAPVAAAAP